jgi:phytoene dehydrogenase-like protein
MIPYLMIQEGVFYPEGGVAAIPAAFERLARELGVEVRTDTPVFGLEVSQGRVRRVCTQHEKIEADAVISNVDRLTTRSWLGHGVDWPPSLSYYTIHWGLDRPLREVRHHTLLVPRSFEKGFEQLYRERRFPEEPIVYLNETAATDHSVAPPNHANLFAVITSPAVEAHLDWENNDYRDRVVGLLARFGIDVSSPLFERIQTPLGFQNHHGNYRGSLYGPDEAHRTFGLFPLRVVDEEYGNLYYAGGSVQPGAGLPMVTLSGRFAAEALGR